MTAKVKRQIALYVLIPVAVVCLACYAMREHQSAKAAYEAEKWKLEHKLTPVEETAVLEKLKNASQDFKLKHPDWNTNTE